MRSTGTIVDGSPLIAVKHAAAPFTKVILCDLADENVAALRQRTRGDERVLTIPGDCNENIDRVVLEIPPYGLNLALVDPYGLAPMASAPSSGSRQSGSGWTSSSISLPAT